MTFITNLLHVLHQMGVAQGGENQTSSLEKDSVCVQVWVGALRPQSATQYYLSDQVFPCHLQTLSSHQISVLHITHGHRLNFTGAFALSTHSPLFSSLFENFFNKSFLIYNQHLSSHFHIGYPVWSFGLLKSLDYNNYLFLLTWL